MRYLDRIGARDSMVGPAAPIFPFIDRADGSSWVLRLDAGRLPFWIFDRRRRVPGTGWRDYLALLRLRGARGSVAEALGDARTALPAPAGAARYRGLEHRPRCRAGLAHAGRGGADPGRGRRRLPPLVPREGLSESFIDPAIAWLRARGAELRLGHRVQSLEKTNGHVSVIHAGDEAMVLGPRDGVVLAVPAPVAGDLLTGLMVPDAFEAILNLHYLAEAPAGAAPFIGVVGGLAEWVFIKPGIVSVTISAANRLADVSAATLAAEVWPDVRAACPALPEVMPGFRVVREKRATFAATAMQQKRRPAVDGAGLANLALAGDWTATGLPATIEGSIRSGETAAGFLLRHV